MLASVRTKLNHLGAFKRYSKEEKQLFQFSRRSLGCLNLNSILPRLRQTSRKCTIHILDSYVKKRQNEYYNGLFVIFSLRPWEKQFHFSVRLAVASSIMQR